MRQDSRLGFYYARFRGVWILCTRQGLSLFIKTFIFFIMFRPSQRPCSEVLRFSSSQVTLSDPFIPFKKHLKSYRAPTERTFVTEHGEKSDKSSAVASIGAAEAAVHRKTCSIFVSLIWHWRRA